MFTHKINRKYVAWPHGRGFTELSDDRACVQDLMPMLRVENAAWGATDILPVLEIHSVLKRTGELKGIYQLTDFDSNIRMWKEEGDRRKVA